MKKQVLTEEQKEAKRVYNKERYKIIGKQILTEEQKEAKRVYNRKRIENNIETIKAKALIYREKNKDIINAKTRTWHDKNKERQKLLRELNKEKFKKSIDREREKITKKIYREKNKEKIRLNNNKWTIENRQKRIDNNPLFKLKENIRGNIRMSFKNRNLKKTGKTIKILGCSFEQLRQHLESQFQPWMNWNNHGHWNGYPVEYNTSWDIDHIIPLATATCEADVIRLNHYTNLQPLCSVYNRKIKRG